MGKINVYYYMFKSKKENLISWIIKTFEKIFLNRKFIINIFATYEYFMNLR